MTTAVPPTNSLYCDILLGGGLWIPACAGMTGGVVGFWVSGVGQGCGVRVPVSGSWGVLRLREGVVRPTLGGRMYNPLPSLRTNGGGGKSCG